MDTNNFEYALEKPEGKNAFVSKTIFLRLQSYGIPPNAIGTNIYFCQREMLLAKARGIVVHSGNKHFYVAPTFLADWSVQNPGAFIIELKFWASETEAATVRGLPERTTHTRINEPIAQQY